MVTEDEAGSCPLIFFHARNVVLGMRIPSTASILKGQMYKGEIYFSLSLNTYSDNSCKR